jgi:vanillate O-demethylase monooxygenase subunit
MVWVWTGDLDKVDPSLIPNYDWINESQWGYGSGFYHVKANYLTIHENLMDITHFQYLHGSALGTPKHAEAAIEVTVKANTVDNFRINEGETVPDLHRDATGLKDAIITRHAHSTFVTPGYHEGLGLFEDKEGTNNGRVEYRPRILHFVTPETQYTFLYWWLFARDFSAPDSELDEWYSKTTSKVFEEDKDAIEWIEEQWATDHRPEFREKHVPADEGAVKMRRIVHKLAMEETV